MILLGRNHQCLGDFLGPESSVEILGLPSHHSDSLYDYLPLTPPTSCEKQQSCQQPHHC